MPQIGEPGVKPIAELNTYYKNARRGDVDAIKQSMLANGVYKPLVVNVGTKTGRPNEVLAGSHSLMAMSELASEFPNDKRWLTADVWLVDVDDEQAAKIVLVDNRASDIATNNTAALISLLDSLDGDLDGTGYNLTDLDQLNAAAELERNEEAVRESLGKTEPVDNVEEGEPVGQEFSTEIDPDAWGLNVQCPECGFEWEE